MGCLKLAHIEEEKTVLKCVWKSDEHEKTHVRVYDYGARMYDAQLGRWHSVDPMAEAYYSFTPYNYVMNNPMNYTDPNGMYAEGTSHFNNVFGGGSGGYWGSRRHQDGGGAWAGGRNLGPSLSDFNFWYKNVKGNGSASVTAWHARKNEFAKAGGISISGKLAGHLVAALQDGMDVSIGENDILISDPNQYAQSNGDNQSGNGGNQGVNPDFYYHALDGIILNNGSVLTKDDFVLTFNFNAQANATYLGFNNGKYYINFSIGDFEVTTANVRNLTIHEVFGHGVMGYGDGTFDHYKAYFVQIDSQYWTNTTANFKYIMVKHMWQYYYNEVGYQRMPEPYQSTYDTYINH